MVRNRRACTLQPALEVHPAVPLAVEFDPIEPINIRYIACLGTLQEDRAFGRHGKGHSSLQRHILARLTLWRPVEIVCLRESVLNPREVVWGENHDDSGGVLHARHHDVIGMRLRPSRQSHRFRPRHHVQAEEQQVPLEHLHGAHVPAVHDEDAENAATAEKLRKENAAEAEAEEERKATAAAKKAKEDERKAERLAAELAEKQANDAHMTSGAAGSVWEVIESGDLYFSYGASDQFTCGRWDCVMVQVVSLTGCPGGAYVEAAIENSDGAVVGWTNVRIGALEPEQVGADLLEDVRGIGSSFNVNEVKCRRN